MVAAVSCYVVSDLNNFTLLVAKDEGLKFQKRNEGLISASTSDVAKRNTLVEFFAPSSFAPDT